MIKNIGKLLIVDDEVELKNILVEALTSQGYETAGFTSGEEALAALRDEAFDVLLTDLMMPGMDGIALVRDALQIDPHLVAIMMTGQGTIQTAVDAMKVGAFDYVLKPFRLQTVMPVLTRAMNTRLMRLENLQLRETVAIYELSQTIAFTLDPQTVTSKLADAALQQTDADEVSILFPTENGEELYVAAVRGENRQKLLGERVPLHESISSWVVNERTPLILDGEVNDERFRALWPRPEIRSAISIPMQIANKLIGTININALDRARPFTLGQMKALTILASTAAAALESASLYTQVRKAEENYRSIFENAVEGIFRSTPEGRFITVNPAMARILGYDSPEELIAEVTDVARQLYVDSTDRETAAQLEEERGVLHAFQFEAYRKDGEKIWLSLNRRSIRDQNGIELYREGSIEDITERKRAEYERERLVAEIEKQRERLNNIVATVPGVVWEAWGQPDAGTQQMNFVSDYVETMLGYSVEEWLSTPNFWLQIVHPHDREEAGREAAANFVSGKSSTVEFRWVAKDGHEIWVESNYVVIPDAQGQPGGVRGVTIDITERKRVEEALRETARSKAESLALLDTTVSSAPVGFAFHNCELVFERINETLAAINGLSVEEHLGRTLHEVLPEMAPIIEPLLQRVLDTAEPVIDFELNGETRADPGHKHHWVASFYPVRMQGGEILGVGVLVADVTARKQAEEALRESEERYRDLVENAHDIIYSHDLEGNYLSVNRAGEQATGYTHDECLQLNIRDTVAPEHAGRIREMIARKLAGETGTAYEIEIMAKDGRRIDVEVNTKLMFEDGVPVGVQGIARDITERKLAQAELTRLATAVEQTADSIVITDTDGNIQYVNPAFERITGYSKEEVLGQNPRILKSARTDPAVYRDLWQSITRGDVWVGQLVNKKKDGSLFNERATISAVRDHSGKIAHYIAVKQDTTRQILLEEQLRQSQKMEAIGQLAGGVAHDFNNLLTAINGYSSLALQRVEEHNSIRPFLEEVKKAGERAANLTRQLLAFGRKQILQPVSLNLNDVVTDLNKMLRRLIGEDIEFISKLDPKLEKIKADPGQIEQVLMNLVVNARDAMPQGGTLTIETSCVELDERYAARRIGARPGRYIMLAVSDTGIGMDEQTKARIFDPFFTTKEKGKGTGLGLSTVYGIVKQSGGNIWVYSELNRGTTFKVYLPQIETTAPEASRAEMEIAIPSGSETILLVEDEDVVRGLATQILEQAGYKVIAAARGDEAVRICRDSDEQIDLLLTDVVMPQTSGKEVADQLSQLMPGLKVLFMSGYTDEAIVHHGVLDSNIEFIQKPFTPAALATKIREVLDTSGNGHPRGTK